MFHGEGEGLQSQILVHQLGVGVLHLLQPLQGCVVGHHDEGAPEEVIRGPLGLGWSLNGDIFVKAWGTSQIASNGVRRSWSQWQSSFLGNFQSIIFRVQLNLSTKPSIWEWYTKVLSLLIPRSRQTCFLICRIS